MLTFENIVFGYRGQREVMRGWLWVMLARAPPVSLYWKNTAQLPKAVQQSLVWNASVTWSEKHGDGWGFLALLTQGRFGREFSAFLAENDNVNFFLFTLLCKRFPHHVSGIKFCDNSYEKKDIALLIFSPINLDYIS